ncbi:MAG TPA: hypothetical protein VK658_13930 [Chryseolinea sp.]|nr:hypothetical protein [Chryseolinea sp.]
MKISTVKTARRHIALASCIVIFMSLIGCSPGELTTRSVAERKQFVSEEYNHFEGGVFFSDVAAGLDVLWSASFRYGHTFKENAGFFVPEGLVILPNKNNTFDRASLSAFGLKLIDGKLFITVHDQNFQVLAIIHTHPDAFSQPMPAPRNDYQFGYLGIHNYVMSRYDLFDAYTDPRGGEFYDRLGGRTAYLKIPLLRVKDMDKSVASALWVVSEK